MRTVILPAQLALKLDNALDKILSEHEAGVKLPKWAETDCKPGEVLRITITREVPNRAQEVLNEAVKRSGIRLVKSDRTFADVKADRARKGIR